MVFGRGRSRSTTPVYQRPELGAGDRFDGPAIVEERETTAVIRPGWYVEVGADGSLIATATARPTTNGSGTNHIGTNGDAS